MTPTRLIEVRQPRPYDLISETFVIAGIGSAFEGVAQWRVLDVAGNCLGGNNLVGVGANGVLLDFGERVTIGQPAARGEQVTLQVFGDDASGQNPPGPDLNQTPVTLFSSMTGWLWYEVNPGDNLGRIASTVGLGGTASDDILNANRDVLSDPNLIFPGQIVRVPLFA